MINRTYFDSFDFDMNVYSADECAVCGADVSESTEVCDNCGWVMDDVEYPDEYSPRNDSTIIEYRDFFFNRVA